jgi:CRP-like cAMP-binding protein
MEEVIKHFVSRFMPVTDMDIDDLMQFAERRNFDKKIVVVYEGEHELYLNFIIKGLAKKYFIHEKDEIVTQIAAEGNLICAADSLLSGKPSVYYVETIEPTTFLSFSKASIEKLYSKDAKWEKLGRLVLTKLLIDKERWDIDLVQLTTQDRLSRFIQDHRDLVRRVPQKILASYLGIQPETFSRLKHIYKEIMVNG